MNNLEERLKKIKDLTSIGIDKIGGSKYSHINYWDVIGFLKTGLKMPQVAEIYNCSVQTLRYQIKLDHPEFNAKKYVRWGKTEITDRQIKEAYKKLQSVTKVAIFLKMSKSGVAKRLHKIGEELKPRTREDISTEDIVRLYKKYKRTSIVAEILEINMKLARDRLSKAGIKLDLSYQHEPRRTDIPVNYVLKLYDNRKSMEFIANKYDVDWRTIKRILIKNKRKIRKR